MKDGAALSYPEIHDLPTVSTLGDFRIIRLNSELGLKALKNEITVIVCKNNQSDSIV